MNTDDAYNVTVKSVVAIELEDVEKRMAFGMANVFRTAEGDAVVDSHEDTIDTDEAIALIEDAVYRYVLDMGPFQLPDRRRSAGHLPTALDEASVMQVAELFVKGGYTHRALPVMKSGRLVGVVSRLSVVQAVVDYFKGVDRGSQAESLYISALKELDEKPTFE